MVEKAPGHDFRDEHVSTLLPSIVKLTARVRGLGMARNANVANASGSAHKIDDIQILRGVAITMVLICHLSFSSTLFSALPVRLTNPFYAGVELFFVISGFVVTRSLIRGNYEPVAFLIRRGFRLYPPILAFLAFGGIVNAFIRLSDWPRYAADHLCAPLSRFTEQATAILGGYLINLGGGISYMNGAMWSLSVEFQFYAAVAIVAIATLALRGSPRITGYAIVVCAAVVYALCFYSRILLMPGRSQSRSWLPPLWFSYPLQKRFTDWWSCAALRAALRSLLRGDGGNLH
jgi:peptidoglycan/LPS O-acetylase OafA/YrhL